LDSAQFGSFASGNMVTAVQGAECCWVIKGFNQLCQCKSGFRRSSRTPASLGSLKKKEPNH